MELRRRPALPDAGRHVSTGRKRRGLWFGFAGPVFALAVPQDLVVARCLLDRQDRWRAESRIPQHVRRKSAVRVFLCAACEGWRQCASRPLVHRTRYQFPGSHTGRRSNPRSRPEDRLSSRHADVRHRRSVPHWIRGSEAVKVALGLVLWLQSAVAFAATLAPTLTNGELGVRIDALPFPATLSRELESGLTNRLYVRVSLFDGQTLVQMRTVEIAIRYDLWEETFT